jgi:hypothetical protein
MQRKLFLFILLIFSLTLFGQGKESTGSFVDFGLSSNSDNFKTFPELEIWANYQGWKVDPDQNYAGIKDQVAQMITSDGLEFSLNRQNQEKRETFLYLELVRYHPSKYSPLPSRIMKIYINGFWKETVEISSGKNFRNPIIIRLDPSDFTDTKIVVRLEPYGPMQKGAFWGIWDAFLSNVKIE